MGICFLFSVFCLLFFRFSVFLFSVFSANVGVKGKRQRVEGLEGKRHIGLKLRMYLLLSPSCYRSRSRSRSRPYSLPSTTIIATLVTARTCTTTMSVQTTATIASFGGKLLKLKHNASTTNCEMAFNLYLPPQATTNPLHKVPVLIWLSGLTCTGDNCAEKGFFQHRASQKGIAVVYPDTSPRKPAASMPAVGII